MSIGPAKVTVSQAEDGHWLWRSYDRKGEERSSSKFGYDSLELALDVVGALFKNVPVFIDRGETTDEE